MNKTQLEQLYGSINSLDKDDPMKPPTPQHRPHRLYDEKGNEIECHQRDTIQRIFTLWHDLETQTRERDAKIKEAFENTTKEIEDLRNDLDKRKFINNYNEKEKQLLKDRVDEVGHKSEEEDKTLQTKVSNIDDRLIKVETSLPQILKTVEDTAGKYDKLFYLLVAFFILFMIKTFIWGY